MKTRQFLERALKAYQASSEKPYSKKVKEIVEFLEDRFVSEFPYLDGRNEIKIKLIGSVQSMDGEVSFILTRDKEILEYVAEGFQKSLIEAGWPRAKVYYYNWWWPMAPKIYVYLKGHPWATCEIERA